MTVGTIVTPSGDGAAASTLHGEAHYTPVPSRRPTSVATVPVGRPVSDEQTQELRRRLRGER